jgi:quercetin dioxygenase-like cupin family protein
MSEYTCPTCQQPQLRTRVDVRAVAESIRADKLSAADAFRRTYLGHGRSSSVFVFQGHRGPFRRHVHLAHDEIGYVLSGSGRVTIGDEAREVRPGDVWVIPANTPHGGEFAEEPVEVLFVSSPQEDPEHPDRVWVD